MERTSDRVELAALVAAVSLAADMASGVTLEHGLRTCLLTTRLAERAGLDATARPGLQIVAPAGGEQTVLALAAQLERLRP